MRRAAGVPPLRRLLLLAGLAPPTSSQLQSCQEMYDCNYKTIPRTRTCDWPTTPATDPKVCAESNFATASSAYLCSTRPTVNCLRTCRGGVCVQLGCCGDANPTSTDYSSTTSSTFDDGFFAISTPPTEYGCFAKTWADADAFCEFRGTRLCTEAELLDGVASSSGCQSPDRKVWTSTSCAGGSGGQNTGRSVVDANAWTDSTCISQQDLDRVLHLVTCCAEIEPVSLAVRADDAEYHLCANSTDESPEHCVSRADTTEPGPGRLPSQVVMLGSQLRQQISVEERPDAYLCDARFRIAEVTCDQPQCGISLEGIIEMSTVLPEDGGVQATVIYNAGAVPAAGNYSATLRLKARCHSDADKHAESGQLDLRLAFEVTSSAYVVLALPQDLILSLPAGDDTTTRRFELFNVKPGEVTWRLECGSVPPWLSIVAPATFCDGQSNENTTLEIGPGSSGELIVRVHVPNQVPPTGDLTSELQVVSSYGIQTETLNINCALTVLPLAEADPNTSTAVMLRQQPDGTLVENSTWIVTAGDVVTVDVAARDQHGNDITTPGQTFKMQIAQDLHAENVPLPGAAWEAEFSSRFVLGTGASLSRFRLETSPVPSKGVFNVSILYIDGEEDEREVDRVVLRVLPVECNHLGPAQANALGAACNCMPGHGLGPSGVCVLCSQVAEGDTRNLHSTTGFCSSCAPGKQPHNNLTACAHCYDGWASADGFCEMCPAGKRPTVDRRSCEFCDAGKEPMFVDENDPVYTTNGTTCVECDANETREANYRGGCEVCIGAAYEIPNEEQSRCESCPSGHEPATNSSVCVPCPEGKARFIQDTEGCYACEPSDDAPQGDSGSPVFNQVPNPDQSGCQLCEDGKQPDQSRAACVSCPPGTVRAANEPELCRRCNAEAGEVPDGDNRTCELCPNGKEPRPDGAACVSCPPGAVRAADEAERCHRCASAAGEVPDGDNRTCELCQTGHEPHPDGAVCVRCPAGRARDRDAPGPCSACDPGKAPYPGMGEEQSARECQTCDTGHISLSGRACQPCPAGKQPDDLDTPTACYECTGVQYNADPGTTCTDCEPGKEPNQNYTACEICPPMQAIGPEGKCEPCPEGSIPKSDASECTLCGAGKEPNADGSACVPCAENSATDPSKPGRCRVCTLDGKVPNINRTSCVACPAHSHPILNPGTFCGCNQGYFVDPHACKPADGRCEVDRQQLTITADADQLPPGVIPSAPCCKDKDHGIVRRNRDLFDAYGRPRRDTVAEPDSLICSPCPVGSKCFDNNIVVALPGRWVDPTGEMVPRKITKTYSEFQKVQTVNADGLVEEIDLEGLVAKTEIRAVACLPLNCPGYCYVAFDEKTDFSPNGEEAECSKPVWKFCSSRDPSSRELRSQSNWTGDTMPWQKEVQRCYDYGKGLRGWRQTPREWPPLRNLTANDCLDDFSKRKAECFGELDVDAANIVNGANVCRKGSTGRLCSTCLAGYEKVEGTCVSCTDTDYMSIVQASIMYSLMCMFFMHKSRRVVTGRDCDIHNSSCIIGISVFFVQTATLLKFNFGRVAGLQSKLVGVMRMQVDDPEQDDGACLSTGEFYVDYAMKFWVQIFVLMFSAIISIVFKLQPWQQKMTVFFALQFCLFPINLRSMQIWFCRSDLHSTKKFLYIDPAEECDLSAGWGSALFVFSCVIAVFACVMPYYMYTHMKHSMKNHGKLLKVECYLNFGFKKGAKVIEAGEIIDSHSPEYAARDFMSVVYYPLRRRTYWWAIVWLLRPTLVALVYNARDPSTGVVFSIADWRVLVLIVLMIYNCLQASIQPFKHSNESLLDAISVLLLMLLFVININQDFMTATGADVRLIQVVNFFASITLLACVLLATLMSKKATNAQIARMVARSRWKTAWNNMSSESSDPLGDVGSLVAEAETSTQNKRFAKLSQLGIASTKLSVFQQIDVDASGMISLDEFLEWWTLRTLRTGAAEMMKDVARDLFERFDLDGSGEVDRVEFEQILVGLRTWHEEQKAMLAQIEEPLEVRQAEVKAEVQRVITNMQSKGWMLVGTQWTRAQGTLQLNPLQDGAATAFEIEGDQMPAEPSVVGAGSAISDQAPSVEQIFAAIDVDRSGELSVHEFSQWWRNSGGDDFNLAKAQEAFRLVELRDGVPGVTLVEFKEVMVAVATDTWQEAIDPASGRKYFINPVTQESSWLVPGIECVQPFLQAAGITNAAATRLAQHTASEPAQLSVSATAAVRVSSGNVLGTSKGSQAAVLDGLRQSEMVGKIINQLSSKAGGPISHSDFADWWARHKRPDLPVMDSLKFSRPFNKAFKANNGSLDASGVLQVLQGMWETKHDTQTGRTEFVQIASNKSVWEFTGSEADAWLQTIVVL